MRVEFLGHLAWSLILCLLVSACGIDVEIDTKVLVWDPLQTQLLLNQSAVADGASRAKVQLKVIAETGDIMGGLKLRAQANVSDHIFLGCSPSDGAGITDCYFTSISPGTRTFELTDGNKTMSVDVTFTAPTGSNQLTKVTFSKSKRHFESGYTIDTSLHYNQFLKQKEAGYTFETHISPQYETP